MGDSICAQSPAVLPGGLLIGETPFPPAPVELVWSCLGSGDKAQVQVCPSESSIPVHPHLTTSGPAATQSLSERGKVFISALKKNNSEVTIFKIPGENFPVLVLLWEPFIIPDQVPDSSRLQHKSPQEGEDGV